MHTSVFIATSLDGYIAREDGDLAWLHEIPAPPGEDYGFAAFLASVDALVMGRATYETVLGFDAWPYGERRMLVPSRRPLTVPARLQGIVEAVGGDGDEVEPAALLARLEAEGARRVYVDGGETVRRFLRAGLLDDLTLTTLPRLLGAGLPLFAPPGPDLALEHVGTQAFASGLVQSRYRVRR